MVELPLIDSTTMDTEEEEEDDENPDCRRDVYGKEVGDVILPSASSTTRNTEGSHNPDQRHSSRAIERATAAAEKKAGLQQFQIALRQKLTPKVWTSAGALDQWFSGRNKHRVAN